MQRNIGLILCLALLLPACGRKNQRPAVHPVQGTVIYDGQPAAGVQVFLFPMDAPSMAGVSTNPRALTSADGRFSITTFTEGDGAAEGEYLVILHWPDKTTEREESPRDRLFGWYDAAHTSLKVQVKAGDNALAAFNIAHVSEPPPKSQGIPGRN